MPHRLSTISAEIFSVPLETGEYLIYAPKRRIAFVANSKTVNVVVAFKNAEHAKAEQYDKSTVEFLCKLGIFDDAYDSSHTFFPSPKRSEVSFDFLISSNSETCCSYCDTNYASQICKTGIGRPMDLLIARKGIDLLFECMKDLNRNTGSVNFHGVVDDKKCWSVLTDSMSYLQKKSSKSSFQIKSLITTRSFPQGINQIQWMSQNLDSCSLIIEAGYKDSDIENGLGLRDILDDVIVKTLESFEKVLFPYELTLALKNDQVISLPDVVDLILHYLRPQTIRIEPRYRFWGPWDGNPSSETVQFVHAFRECRARAMKSGIKVIFPGTELIAHTNFCGKDSGSFTLSPEGELRICCGKHSESHFGNINVLISDSTTSEETVTPTFRQLWVNHSNQVESRSYCKKCFAKFNCAGDCFESRTTEFKGSERCYVIRELTQDQLLDKIALSGGLFFKD